MRPQPLPSSVLTNSAKRTNGSPVAIAIVVAFPGATAEQYDQVVAKPGLTPGGAVAPGQLSHWVNVTDERTRLGVPRETFEKFAVEETVPTVTKVGAFLHRPQ